MPAFEKTHLTLGVHDPFQPCKMLMGNFRDRHETHYCTVYDCMLNVFTRD